MKPCAVRRLALSIHPATSKDRLLLMLNLTSYMDETRNSDDPAVIFSGMAGFVAPAGVWEVFQDRWNSTLQNAGFEMFHMKDFARSTGEFKCWAYKKKSEPESKRFFGRLIELIVETRAKPVGVIVSGPSFRSLTQSQQDAFMDPYYLAFQDCVAGPRRAAQSFQSLSGTTLTSGS